MSPLDLRTLGESVPEALRDCDIAIIGTGPAGATLAAELSTTRLRVTILESGTTDRLEANDRLDDIDNVGRPRVPDQWSVRNRILGGSSHTWGGRCAPFDDIDYAYRDWVPASGWPFDGDELAPFLERSARHLGLYVGTGFSDDGFWPLAGRAQPTANPDPRLLLPFFWQFSRDENESYPYEYTRFGRGLEERLGPNVTLVTGATVTQILPTDSGRSVRGVEFVDAHHRVRTLHARTVVLATGGIENARVLLNSTALSPNGLGNAHDVVGRYLMDHLRGPVGHFDVASSTALLKRLGRYNVRGRLFRAGFRLSPEVQRAEGLLNAAAWLGEEVAADDPWDALRRIIRGAPELPGDVTALLRGAPLMARGIGDYFVQRNGIPRRLSAVPLLAMIEQVPDPDSRVTLSKRRDAFGLPLPQVDWRSHPDEGRTMRRTAEIVADQLREMGFPAPELADWVNDGEPVPDTFVDVAHPTGTTRMATSPRQGVVDANSMVHGTDGLYVMGSSVFPTAGHCNPTQMIVAMAVRLADHLAAHRPAAIEVAAGPTVVLTGGTGRIGRIVVQDLLSRGYRVRATTSQSALPETVPGLEWRRLDLETAGTDELTTLLEGADAVLHLAAEIGKQARMPAVNARATGLLAEAAEATGVRSFVYTSTVSVYGSGRRRRADENAPTLTPDRDVAGEYLAMDYVRTYGRTKLLGELAIAGLARTVAYTVLRPAVVVDERAVTEIGDWDRTKRILAAHRHAHHVYVRDVSDALIWAMERGLTGELAPGAVETFNVAEDERQDATHRAFLKKAYAVTGDRRFQVLAVPGAADWLHDLLRFRRVSARNPLWRMRFPSDKLRAAGFRPRHGMRVAEGRALDLLRAEAIAADADPEVSGPTGPAPDRQDASSRTAAVARQPAGSARSPARVP